MPLLVLVILAREVAVGAALWAGAFLPGPAAPGAWLAVLVATVAGSHLRGVTPARTWQSTVGEAALLFVGGMCVAALLTRAVAMPPWLSGAWS